MQKRNWSRKFAWLSAGLTVIVMVALLGTELFLSPGRYLFEVHGDHIKNYYVTAYYIKYNVGLWFTGMNYPFGELALFSDNQPLFSVPLAWVHRHVWPIADYVTAGQNLFLFCAMAFGAWCLQRVLLRLHLPAWYAAVAGVLIVLLSPQNTQFDFQYALSYPFALVLPWLLLIKYFEHAGSWKWWFAYWVVSLSFGFIHVYFFAINGLFGVGVALAYAVQEKELKPSVKLLAGALLPSAFFLLFMAAVDSVPDRPQHPEGFFVHRANLEGIFWPYDQYYLPALQKLFPSLQDSRQVSYAFVGVGGLLCVLYFLVKGTKYLLRRRFSLLVRPVLPAPLRWSVWPAVGMLLFALAIPLKYGLQEVVDHSPFLEQFRILYRFAWMFYYVYASVVAYFFFALYRRVNQRHPKVAVTLLVILLTLWAVDAVFFIKTEIGRVKNFPVGYSFNGREGNLRQVFQEKGHPVEQFQAILPLPYFSLGSEKIDVGYPYRSVYEAMRLSLQTGLPMATMMMARTSQAQALAQVQLLSNDLIEKSLLPRLPNQKPFLVMATTETLGPLEKSLRQKATFLFQEDSVSYYRLILDSLRQDQRAAVLQKFSRDSSTMVKKKPLYLSGDKPVVWRQLGAQNRGGVFCAGNARVKEGPLWLYHASLPVSEDTLWTASVWVNALADRQLPELHYEQLDTHGAVLEKQKVSGSASFEVYGSWIKIDLSLKRLSSGKLVRIWLQGRDVWASSFLLKPVGTAVYWRLSSEALLYNNYMMQEDSNKGCPGN